MNWATESWQLIVGGLAVLGAVVTVIATTISAEKDRQALKAVRLEHEKLQLEILQLRNNPESVADRRAIYDRLRAIVGELTRDAAVALHHIPALHEIWHDASFRFPDSVTKSIQDLIASVARLHVAGRMLERGRGRLDEAEWMAAAEEDHQAVLELLAFERGMVELFKPYLSL